MSNRRSAMERFKQGISSDEEEEDDYNEEENDSMDDFVIDDQDVGYKASSHQKQSQSRDQRQKQTRTNHRRVSQRSKANKSSTQSQSCSISRRNRSNKSKKATKTNTTSQSKTQSSMKSFFKPATSKPRNVIKKQSHKKKNKTAKKQNDDDFMNNILTNMDSDEDDDDDNQQTHDVAPQVSTNDNNALDENTVMDIVQEDDFDTQPQTQVTLHQTQTTQPQPHYTQQQEAPLEPPKKRFKMTPAPNQQPVITRSDKMEMDENDDEEDTKNTEDDESNKCEEIPQAHSLFNNKNTTHSSNNNKEETMSSTDNYPSCAQAGYIDFFWFDAYEDALRKPGQIYLFGKTLNARTHEWESICLFIGNISRVMYILPRLKNKTDDIENGERVEFINVYNEINEKRQRLGIRKFAAGPVEKKYCFRERGEGIPSVATYLKLCYSFEYDSFEGGGRGRTYQRIFGARSTALELFFLEKQLMGPCWLRVPFGKPSRLVTWCTRELSLDNMDDVTVLSSNYPSPPLKVLSLSFESILNDKKEHEVACISAVLHDGVYVDYQAKRSADAATTTEYFTLIRKIDRNPFPYNLSRELAAKNYNVNATTFRSFASERELLTYFTTRIHKLDPDVIVGHRLFDFLLDVILHRMDKLNIKNVWSKIGRLRKNKMPFFGGKLMKKYLGCGRLLCDTFLSSQEFIRCKTYTLSHLVMTQLGVAAHENLNPSRIRKEWFDGTKLASIITHCCNDSNLVFNLMSKLQLLPLTKELTNLCGNLWARSLTSQRAERNEWLLLHEFHRNGYIVPERLTNREKIDKGIVRGDKTRRRRGKAQYSGGLVLDPVRGLYDKYVICLDFNSLYPSIIQEYNLCFTSTPHWQYNTSYRDDEDKKGKKDVTLMQQDIAAQTGILPKVIGVLLTRRSSVKNLLKSAKLESQKRRFDIQQKALKLVANSMYGCLGFEHSRFYCKPIAALITALGRESLMKASEMASSIGNLRVIYGDTDSIFIYTDCSDLIEARAYAAQIKKKVNKTYAKMYLELDYVFSKMLLLRKKKYAAIKVISFDSSGGNIRTTKEIKGLDLVRRDWSLISKQVGKEVLDCILCEEEEETTTDDVVMKILELLRKYRRLIDENGIKLAQFQITKKLTKQPKDYPDATKQAHVMVAIQMQSKLAMNVGSGSFIEYIVCKQSRGVTNTSDSAAKSIAQRAYHIREIEEANGALEVDREWYLSQQILPPVARYCEVIEGTDMARLAHALGVDKTVHVNQAQKTVRDDDDEDPDIDEKILRIMNPLRQYATTCVALKIKCRYCRNTYDFCGVFNFATIDAKCGLICATPHCKGIVSTESAAQRAKDIARIKNSLSLQIWPHVAQYYARQSTCADIGCNFRTRQTILNEDDKCPKIGCAAKMKQSFPANKLFDQLRYFAFLFDAKKSIKLLKQEKKKENNLTPQQQSVFDDILSWYKRTIMNKSKYYFIDSKQIFKFCI
eukprot:199673_1